MSLGLQGNFGGTGAAGGGGGGATNTYQLFSTSLPGAPSAGDTVTMTDCPYRLEYTGSAWIPTYDPYDLTYFRTAGMLDIGTDAVEVNGYIQIPAFDATFPATNTTFTRENPGHSGNIKRVTSSGNTGVFWDLTPNRGQVLFICSGMAYGNNTGVLDIYVQKTTPVGTTIDDAYGFRVASAVSELFKESGGISSLYTDDEIDANENPTDEFDYAIFVDGTSVKARVRRTGTSWIPLDMTVADSTFTTFNHVGVGARAQSANSTIQFAKPLAFGRA